MPLAAKLHRTSGLFKKVGFLRKTSAPGSEAARDKWFVQKKRPNFKNKFCPRQRSNPGQVACSNETTIFEKKFCPRQRSCPGQVVCSKKSPNFEKKYAPGSEAARDKWLVKKQFF